jgi:hypothetical protein
MTLSCNISARKTQGTMYERLSVGVVALVGLVSAVFPILRMFFKLSIEYNEGWNVYNAARITHHVALYGQQYSLTQVIYPPLSFFVVAWLHYLGFDYLMAGRTLSLASLLACCVLVGLVAWRLTHNRRAAMFASFFCLTVFCNVAPKYVGMDDPQIFAQTFFLGGLLMYISGPPGLARLAATSLLFIVGGNIKHNLVEFPLAVLVDLCFVGRRKVAEYVVISSLLLGISIAVSMLVAGSYFISNILMPRTYSFKNAVVHFVQSGFGPLQIPFLVVALWSVQALRNTTLRIGAIFFWSSLLVGFAFGGGSGLNVNVYFGLYLSLSVMIGLFLHWFWEGGALGLGVQGRWGLAGKLGVPLVLLLSLAPTWFSSPHRAAFHQYSVTQGWFLEEVSFLRSRPGPAICESLLLCSEAGKPFELSPFDTFMLVSHGKLSERPIIEGLQKAEFGAVQLNGPVDSYLEGYSDRFSPAFAAATFNHYKLAFQERGSYIYVPKLQAAPPSTAVTDGKVTGMTAASVEELRKRNGVVGIEDAKSEKMLAELPAGVGGFTNDYDIVFSDSVDKIKLSPHGYLHNFELQKLRDGKMLIVAFVGQETREHVRSGLSVGDKLTLYSNSWKEAQSVVALPARDIKCERTRWLDVEPPQGSKRRSIVALDCRVSSAN